MKTSPTSRINLRTFTIGALLAIGALSIPLVQADEKAERVQIPATSAAIWQSIDHEMADLGRTIEGRKLADVHHMAFAIRDLVAALPAHSASLPADRLATVKSSNKFVAILAERLDTAGDSNDAAAAASNFRKLQDVLKGLRDNYRPAELH